MWLNLEESVLNPGLWELRPRLTAGCSGPRWPLSGLRQELDSPGSSSLPLTQAEGQEEPADFFFF